MAAEHGFATRQPGATVWYSVVQCGTVWYGGGMEPHNSPAFDEFTDIKCEGDGGVMSDHWPGSLYGLCFALTD